MLCELDGLSRRDAAERLGVAEGTLSSRLAKARKVLAERLRKRGVALPAGLAAVLASSPVSARLAAKTSAVLTADPVPATVALLTNGVFRTMYFQKLAVSCVAAVRYSPRTSPLFRWRCRFPHRSRRSRPHRSNPPPNPRTRSAPRTTAAAPAMHEVRDRLQSPAAAAAMIPDLVGGSSAMEAVRQAVIKAAASPFPVLIEGESGAGKELVARAVHIASIRRGRRFSALNCAAFADELVEAELFGHTRGAFTGAVAERVGLFEECQGGTLFLDEVAELSARVQAKLLRTLQEGEVRRLGESAIRKVDARIVAATNRPLGGEVSAGRFRNDLRYRLDVLRITIPPLRERLEDLPALVRHIWSVLSERTGSRAVLSPSALSRLGAHDWPGNVRELQNVLASMMVVGPKRGVIGPQALPGHITRANAVTSRATLATARREFEERYVRAALARSGGRAIVAARELGVSRQGLRKLTARLGLETLAKPGHALE